MRRALSFLVPTLLLTFASFACEDESTGSPSVDLDGGEIDGSFPPGTRTDAGDTPATPNVTVVVRGGAGPVAGVRVVFHGADGAVVETMLTGADGKATSTGDTTPAMATALLVQGTTHHVVTWTDLEGGDELAVRDIAGQDPVGSYTVTTPTLDGATEFFAAIGTCRESLPGATVIYPECSVGAPFNVLARANGATGVLGFAFLKNAPPPAQAGTAVTVGAWATPRTVTVSATGAGTETIRSRFFQVAGGLAYDEQDEFLNETTQSFEYASADAFPDALQATIALGGFDSVRLQTRRAPANATAITFAFGDFLPEITAPTFDAATPARPKLSWTGDTAATTGGIAHFGYDGAEDGFFDWTFVVKAGTTSVQAPALPAEAAAWVPPPTTTIDELYDPQIDFLESTVLTSRDLRRQAAGVRDLSNVALDLFDRVPAPADGLYRQTGFRYDD